VLLIDTPPSVAETIAAVIETCDLMVIPVPRRQTTCARLAEFWIAVWPVKIGPMFS
jgi:cellulose biosynthesis protein BcsQ